MDAATDSSSVDAGCSSPSANRPDGGVAPTVARGPGRSWMRAAGRVARTDLVCSVRRLRSHPRTLVARVAILGLFWVSFFGGNGLLGANGELDVVGTRTAATALWVFVATTTAMSAPRSLDDVTAGSELVLAAGVRTTVASALAVTAVETGTVFAVFFGTGVVKLALVADAGLLVAAVGSVTLVVGLASAIAVGFAVGIAFKPIGRRLPVVSSHPRAVFVPVLFLAVLALLRPSAVGPVLSVAPTAALGDALLLAYGTGEEVLGVGALAIGVVAVPAFGYCSEVAARHVWFDGDDTGGGGSTRGRRLVATLVGSTAFVTRRPTRAIATKAWLRMLRNPRTLFQLAIPIFTLGAVVVQDPEQIDGFLPVFVAALAGISAGLTLTLNPLALEGDALPALLTTPVAGASVARGYVLAGVLATTPALVVIVLPLGAIIGLPPITIALTVAWGVLVGAFGAVASTAIGFLVPSAGAVAANETEAPTQAAVIAYTTVGFVTAAPGLAGLLTLDEPAGVALLAIDVLVLCSLGALAYVYVARRFERMTVDA